MTGKVPTVFGRPPGLTIFCKKDVPYLYRWYVIPRNRFFNIYLHLLVDDDETIPHDHPWWSVSILLKYGYWEHRYKIATLPGGTKYRRFIKNEFCGRGTIIFRRATTPHYLTVKDHTGRCWSLFITGPVKRTWGFWTKADEWKPYSQVVDHNPSEGYSIHKERV